MEIRSALFRESCALETLGRAVMKKSLVETARW
jgi:hypothetical protein